MTTRYAEGTGVSQQRTVEELQRLLERFGATAFSQATDFSRGLAGIMFTVAGITYRVTMPMPGREDRQFTHTPREGRKRSSEEARKQYEAETRRRWRSLALVLKAKLVAVQDGIVEFTAEFLPYALLGSGHTVAEEAVPRMEEAARLGRAPTVNLLGLPPARGEDQ